MKKEILRIQNLNLPTLPVDYFQNFVLSLLEGEVTCILAPSWSGKTLLAKVLSGSLPFQGYAFFCETAVSGSFKDLASAGSIFCLSRESQLFGQLTIAENIFLALKSGRPHLLQRNKLYQKSVELLCALHLDLNPSVRADTRSPFEQHMILLAAALARPLRVVILDEPAYHYSQQERRRLAAVIRLLRQRNITVLYLSSGIDDISLNSDKVIIMNNSRKVRTLCSTDYFNRYDLMRFFSPRTQTGPMSQLESALDSNVNVAAVPVSSDPSYTSPPLFSAEHLQCGFFRDITLSLRRGEIVGIYDPGNHDGDLLCRILSGIIHPDTGAVLLNGRPLPPWNVQAKVCYLPPDFACQNIFEDLTVLENIHLFHRFSPFCIFRGTRKFVSDTVREQLSISPEQQSALAGSQDIYTRIKIVLYRLLLIRPLVIVSSMPFSSMDYTARGLIRDFFRLFARAGMGVVFTSAQWENPEEMADRRLTLEHGILSPPADSRFS